MSKPTKKNELKRTSFTTSRSLDYFSRKELITQVGHSIELWPVVILKELVDNAIDACEEAGNPPVVKVTVTPDGNDHSRS
jgi:DNA topoisomerase VI subunit B